MSNPIDDAFAAGDAAANRAKQERDEKERQGRVYDRQVEPLVASYVEAVRVKAEEFNSHPRTTNKAAIMPAGTQITIRRASNIGMKDRRIEVMLRRDLGEIHWLYSASPNPVYAEYEPVDSGVLGFYVAGEDLRVQGANSPEQFAEQVLGQYVRDCAHEEANREDR